VARVGGKCEDFLGTGSARVVRQLGHRDRPGRANLQPPNRQAISPGIDDQEQALAELVGRPGLPNAGSRAEYKCPARGANLRRRGKNGLPVRNNPANIYCSLFLDIIMPP